MFKFSFYSCASQSIAFHLSKASGPCRNILNFRCKKFILVLMRQTLVCSVLPKEVEAVKQCMLLGYPLELLHLQQLELGLEQISAQMSRLPQDCVSQGFDCFIPYLRLEHPDLSPKLLKALNEALLLDDFVLASDNFMVQLTFSSSCFTGLSRLVKQRIWNEFPDILNFFLLDVACGKDANESDLLALLGQDLGLYRHARHFQTLYPELKLMHLLTQASQHGCLYYSNSFSQYLP